MDALTDFMAVRFRAQTTAPIIKVEYFCQTKTGTPGNLGVVLAANTTAGIPNISGGVPVDLGGGSPTLTTVAAAAISSTTRITTTLTNSYTPTAGELFWVVLYPTAATYNAGNSYAFRVRTLGLGADYGDENNASSTDTGSTWTRGNAGFGYMSLLTTSDAYISTWANCCIDGTTNTDFDDADNPDERGCAWTLPSNTAAKVYGLHHLLRNSAATSDFNIGCYLGDSSQSSRSIDTSAIEAATGSDRLGTLLFDSPPITVSTAGTLRVAVKATHASDTIRFCTFNFGTQARRESALAFRDYWYCHQNGGGGFTDDLTRIATILPMVEHYGSMSARARSLVGV
jgi:hypothetical protein